MEIVHFGALTDDDRAQLEGAEPDPFDAAGMTLAFRPKDEHIGMRDDAGRLVASAGSRLGRDSALLFCLEDRSGLYRKLDFSVLDSPLKVRQPSGTAVLPQLAMWCRLLATRGWPPGAAELQSLPF